MKLQWQVRGSSLICPMVSRVMYRVRWTAFVILFEQQSADEADDGVVVGKMPTTSARRLISPRAPTISKHPDMIRIKPDAL